MEDSNTVSLDSLHTDILKISTKKKQMIPWRNCIENRFYDQL